MLNLVIKPVWLLLIDRMAQNLLGEVYGEYYLILNLTLITNIFLDLGIQNFNNSSIAADQNFFKRNFKGIFILKALLASLYVLVVAIIGFRSGMPHMLLFILIGNQVLTTFILYLRTNINGLHNYVTDSLLSVSDKFFAILFCLGFYFSGQISIVHFVMAQFMASCITFATALFINLRKWKQMPDSAGMETGDNLKQLIRQSLPYALLFTLMNFYTRMDVSMMNWLLPDAVYHAGLYAQSFRLLDAAAMFAMLFAGLLLPMFARMISEKADVRPLANLAATMLLIISLTAAMASWLFGEKLLSAMYQYENEQILYEALPVFRNIMFAFVPMSMTFVFSTLLTAKKDIWFMNVFALAAFVCNFTINYFLIPEYKSLGASIGSLSTQSLFAILCLWRCFRLFGFKMPWLETGKYLVLLIMLTGLYFLIKAMGNIWIELFVFGSGALLFSAVLNLIEVRKIGRFFDKTPQ